MEVLNLDDRVIQILIERVPGWDVISLRWTHRLADTLARAIETEIDAISGVEEVEMRRYSASVVVAEHVRRTQSVAEEIQAAFRDEPIEGARRFSMPNTTFDVELLSAPTIKPF